MKKLCFVTTVPLTVRAFLVPILAHLRANTPWELTVICDDDATLAADLPEGVRYIPISMKRGISPAGIGAMLKMRKIFKTEKFDYVIVDSPAGIDDGLTLAAAGADMAVIVVSPDYAASRDGEMVRIVLQEMGIPKIGFVINKLDMDMIKKGFAPEVTEITRGFRRELLGVIQADENIHVSTNLGVPIVFMQDTYIAENFRNIAARAKSFLGPQE